MKRSFTSAAVLIVILTSAVCGVYPLVVTGVGQLFWPRQANGSLTLVDGKVVGSELIAQGFVRPEYFHPRPSAAGAGYDAMNSGGSNLGPTSLKLKQRLEADVARLRAENSKTGSVPTESATASASGLDPDITPADAEFQLERVARARNVAASDLQKWLLTRVESKTWAILGERKVNVLKINLELDREFPIHSSQKEKRS